MVNRSRIIAQEPEVFTPHSAGVYFIRSKNVSGFSITRFFVGKNGAMAIISDGLSIVIIYSRSTYIIRRGEFLECKYWFVICDWCLGVGEIVDC